MEIINRRKIIIPDLLFGILLLLLLFVSFISYNRINALNNAANLVDHTNRVNLKLNEIFVNLLNAETGQRGFLLTRDSNYLQPFWGSREKVKQSIALIEALIPNDPRQKENLKILDSLVDIRFSFLIKNSNLNTGQDDAEAYIAPLLKGKMVMDEIRNRISLMMNLESKVLEQRTKLKERTATITPFYSLVLSLVGLFIVSIAYYRLRREIGLRVRAEDSKAQIQQLQQQTKESELRFRNIADTVPVLIWLSGTDTLCHFFNKAWLEFTGRIMEQETGNGWMEGVHPDDFKECLDIYMTSFEKRKEFYMEYRLKRYDGEYRWVSNKGVPRYTPDGTFLGFAGGCMDIQEQKNFALELEKKVSERTEDLRQFNERLQVRNKIFALAEENALLGSYTWNLQTGELEYSDNLFRLFSYEPGEFVPSFEKFVSFIHPDDKEQVIRDGKETYETKKLVEHVYRVITRDGKIKFFRSSGNFVGEDNKMFLVGSVQDISKDRLLTEALTDKNLELERSNAELASFSYIASHDLQEPLRKIQSFSKFLLDMELTDLSGTAKDYFSRIISAAERMQKLIDDLLSYSRSSHSEIKLMPADLNLILEEVKNNLHEVIEEKKVIIETDVLPVLPVIKPQFIQLFSNLISNAIKFSHPHIPPHIRISSCIVPGNEIVTDTVLPQNGEFWKLRISDNGIGFDQKYEHKIFELFQRLHGRSKYEGTGIGLAICKKIVHNHKGAITATGQPGNGAVFTVFLPI